jgi:hypothetical protein
MRIPPLVHVLRPSFTRSVQVQRQRRSARTSGWLSVAKAGCESNLFRYPFVTCRLAVLAARSACAIDERRARHSRELNEAGAGIAEFERALVHQRTRAGREAAKQRGVCSGRPPAPAPDQVALGCRLVDEGIAVRAAAKVLRCHHATLYRALDAAAAASAGPNWYPESLTGETRSEALLVDLAFGPMERVRVLIVAGDKTVDVRLRLADALK